MSNGKQDANHEDTPDVIAEHVLEITPEKGLFGQGDNKQLDHHRLNGERPYDFEVCESEGKGNKRQCRDEQAEAEISCRQREVYSSP
jgi:hypothetical protein